MRLPVRQPVTQYGRLNPLAGAVAERRDIVNFMGSNLIKFDTNFVAATDQDFELQWVSQYPQDGAGGYFLSRNTGADIQANRFLLNRESNGRYALYGMGMQSIFMPLGFILDAKLHLFSYKRVGTLVSFKVDGALIASTTTFSGTAIAIDFNNFGVKFAAATSVPNFRGNFLSFTAWLDGDSKTGALSRLVIANNKGSDVQVGGVMGNTLPGDWKTYKRQKAQNFWTDPAGAKLEIAS